MTARSASRLRVLWQEPAEAAVLSCASKQYGGAYNGDGAKGQSSEQQCCGCSGHRYGVQGSESKHGVDSDTSEPELKGPTGGR